MIHIISSIFKLKKKKDPVKEIEKRKVEKMEKLFHDSNILFFELKK